MNSLIEAGLEIQKFMFSKRWQFCFIGGLAVIRWGEIRMTRDIDLCILTGFGNEEKYIEDSLSVFKPRISDSVNFAITNRVLLMYSSNGTDIDISLAGLPFEEQMIERASPFQYCPGGELTTCSAEDLIILKAFANRMKDWADIEGIFIRQGQNLDISYVIEHLTPLCELKEDSEIMKRLRKLISDIRESIT